MNYFFFFFLFYYLCVDFWLHEMVRVKMRCSNTGLCLLKEIEVKFIALHCEKAMDVKKIIVKHVFFQTK